MSNVDINGVSYPTVIMPDGREWMAVNCGIHDIRGYREWMATKNIPDWEARCDAMVKGDHGQWYTWEEAKKIAASVPGWHLPTKDEFETLVNAIGTGIEARKLLHPHTGYYLKDRHTGEQLKGNDYGFNGLLCGYKVFREDEVKKVLLDKVIDGGSVAMWWSSTLVTNPSYPSSYAHILQLCEAGESDTNVKMNRTKWEYIKDDLVWVRTDTTDDSLVEAVSFGINMRDCASNDK